MSSSTATQETQSVVAAVAEGTTTTSNTSSPTTNTTKENNNNSQHLRHAPLPLTARRIILHIIKVGVRMALFRLIFGFVKQLFIKGAIVKGFKKISVGLETEVVSYNPFKWAGFGMSLAMYRPVQLCLEKILNKFTSKKTESDKKEDDGANTSTTEHHNQLSIAKFLSIVIAGALVSLPISKVFNKNSRTELMLYVTVRAIHSILSGIIYPSGILPAALYKLPTEFWNCTALGIVSTILLGNSTFNPETHSKEYANFLVTATTMQKHQMQSIACMHRHHLSPAVADHCSRTGLNDVLSAVKVNPNTGIQTIEPSSMYCRIVHPNFKSCTLANLDHIKRHFLRVSLPLYGPLKLITTLARGPGPLLKNPKKVLSRLALSTFQSGMFLTLYVCMSYRAVCVFSQTGIKGPILNSLACGVLGGLALMLEPAERQTDLVLFCSMHGLRSGWMLAHKFNYIPRPTMKTVTVAHTAAWATIFLVYEMRPHTLRGLFASMLKFFIGDRKVTHADTVNTTSEKHHPHKQEQQKQITASA